MKIAGYIFLIIGGLSFLGAAFKGHSVFGPLFCIALGAFLVYRANNKKAEQKEKIRQPAEFRENSTVKSIVDDITRAWNELDPELIIRHLSPDFRYDSQWVFDYLTYDGYVEYIRGKFKTLRERGISIEAVTVEDPHFGGWMTKIIQRLDEKENLCYYRIKIENGIVIKGDLCMF